ncbi:Synaptonemal complex protein 2-like, partial [Acanthisitta chloris]
LESLLTDAFKGKGYQKISKLLQEREVEPLQKYSESLFNQLDTALRKELDKNEFQNVSLLLKCIQLYFKSDLQEGKSLFIEQGLVAKMMVSWFERARAFAIIINPDKNKFLALLLEDFFDSALVICKDSNEGKIELVNLFLPELGHLASEANLPCTLRLEALRTFNSILGASCEERKKFPLSEEMCSLTKDLAETILVVGDYDLQVALSEALCRLTIKKWRDVLVRYWFEDNYLAEAFKEIKNREFETDCRKFLNLLNERCGDERRVYSFPCISAFADMKEVKKPSDDKLEEFWIDFNIDSQSVTFYVDSTEGALWDSVRLSREAVNSYSLKEDGREKIVKFFMKIPAALNETEATKIKLCFSAEFEILSALKKVLGDEKMMINMAEEESVHDGKEDRQNEEGDMLKALLLWTLQQKLIKNFTVGPEGEAVVSLSSSAEKSKKSSPRTKAKPRVSLHVCMSLPHTCCLAGRKYMTLKAQTLQVTRSYRNHLFSESNNENTSTDQSEKSWILDSQKDLVPKSVDYSQKRPRLRSNLKVLPLSPPSSGNDYQSEKPGKSRRRSQKPKLRKESESSSKEIDLPTLDLAGISVLIFFNVLEKLFSGWYRIQSLLPVLFILSHRDYHMPHAKEQVFSETFSVLFLDVLSGTVTKKPKYSSQETRRLSSDTSYKPKKIVDSVEEEAEILKGQEMDDSVDDVFYSTMVQEGFSDPGVITSFENFIRQLTKLFWSRYKRMEINTQTTPRSLEKNLSDLLYQIQCRLSNLETFQKTVVEELDSLKKKIQILSNMEKNTLDFWNAQMFQLNSFCSQQKQRYVSASCP